MRYVVVIPVLNQLPYTQQCVDSLLRGGTPSQALLVIDNGSGDGTADWLASRPELPSLRNRVNLGCGAAWTQGALRQESEWTVFMNNDIVACDRLVDRLCDAADGFGLDVISPALVEGPLDYDFDAHASDFVRRTAGVVRQGWFHGVCFAVRRRVFEQIGFPDTDRQLGGREDVEYLVRCLRRGIAVGTTGGAVLHHFGSITQKAIKEDTGQADLGDRDYFYARLGMNWWARKRFKAQRRRMAAQWSREEAKASGDLSLFMSRAAGKWSHVRYL